MALLQDDACNDEKEWVFVDKLSVPDVGVTSGVRTSQGVDSEVDKAGAADEEVDRLLQVEFFEPAQYWTQALPLGNGRLGAMVYGGVPCDLLQLNRENFDFPCNFCPCCLCPRVQR
jgi:hypothetical protein